MSKNLLDLWEEFRTALYTVNNDGRLDKSLQLWEQRTVKGIWDRITAPENQVALREQLATGGSPESDRVVAAAYRASTERVDAERAA